MAHSETANVIVRSNLNEADLAEIISEMEIGRDQIIAITEPSQGKFTLVFAGTPDQYQAYRAELDQRMMRGKRFGAALAQSMRNG